MILSFKQFARAKDRRVFHQAFNDWLCAASDAELDQFAQLREQLAPNQPCSAMCLARECMTHPELTHRLPPLLRQRLQARNWPLASAGEPGA